jgi:hypothetical protein
MASTRFLSHPTTAGSSQPPAVRTTFHVAAPGGSSFTTGGDNPSQPPPPFSPLPPNATSPFLGSLCTTSPGLTLAAMEPRLSSREHLQLWRSPKPCHSTPRPAASCTGARALGATLATPPSFSCARLLDIVPPRHPANHAPGHRVVLSSGRPRRHNRTSTANRRWSSPSPFVPSQARRPLLRPAPLSFNLLSSLACPLGSAPPLVCPPGFMPPPCPGQAAVTQTSHAGMRTPSPSLTVNSPWPLFPSSAKSRSAPPPALPSYWRALPCE